MVGYYIYFSATHTRLVCAAVGVRSHLMCMHACSHTLVFAMVWCGPLFVAMYVCIYTYIHKLVLYGDCA